MNKNEMNEDEIQNRLNDLYEKQVKLEQELTDIQIEINFCLADLKYLNKDE